MVYIFEQSTYLYVSTNWFLTNGYEVKFLPLKMPCAKSAVGAAQIAATMRPAASCSLSSAPSSALSHIAWEPPRPPGKTIAS